MNLNVATVIRVNRRYFRKYNKKSNRIQTAWCLSGARLFGEWEGSREIQEIMTVLHSKKYMTELHEVCVDGAEFV